MRTVHRVADVARAPLRGGVVAICAVQEILEELAAHSSLDLGELSFLGDREREHERRLLDGHERELLVLRRVVENRDVAEHLVGGEDRGDEALAGHPEVGERGHLDWAALGLDLAQDALDLRVEEHAMRCALAEDRLLAVWICAPAGVREKVEARVLDADRALEEIGQGATDLVDALAVEDELGEAAVDLHRALQAPMLGVDDSLEKRRHEVDELHVGGDREERHLQAVGLGDHLGRELAQIGQRPHDEARSASFGDPPDEADLSVEVVFDRKPAGEHEVAGTRLHFWRLHQAHPFDLAIEAFGAGDELGRGKHRAHRLTYGGTGCFDVRFHPLGRHKRKLRVCSKDKQLGCRLVLRALGACPGDA